MIKSPGEFSVVSAKSKTHAKQAKGAGLPVFNKRAVVHVGPGGHARRRGDKLIIRMAGEKHELWFANAKNFRKTIDKALKRKIGKNQTWSFQVGRSPIANQQTPRLDELLRYLQEKDDWHSPDATEHISLVLVTVDRSHVIKRLAVSNDESEEE